MAAQINSNQQLTNLIAVFQQESEESECNIEKILMIAENSLPALNDLEDLSEFTSFRHLLGDELDGYIALQELSKKTTEFLESLNQNIISRQEELNKACYTLHKAEGNTDIGDMFPTFECYFLLRELEHRKAFAANVASPLLDEEDLIDALAEMDFSNQADELKGSEPGISISTQLSEENLEEEGPTHLDSDYSTRIMNAVFDSDASVSIPILPSD